MQKYQGNESCQAGFLTLFEQLDLHYLEPGFLRTDLGQLYQAIPFKELATGIPQPKGKRSGLGRKSWMTVEGGIALQVLKHYTRLSDQMLIHRLNADWTMQLFCGIRLGTKQIRDLNLVSAWRVYLSKHINIDKLQERFVEHWKPYMEHTHVGMADARPVLEFDGQFERGLGLADEVVLIDTQGADKIHDGRNSRLPHADDADLL